FNPSTTLHYGIDKAGKVNIDIYNSRGQRVKSYNQEHSSAGYYRLIWDGTDDNGKTLSSGIYFYKMRTKAFSATRKMILSK
ncbi:MAG: FlgD immunoglobulin-like domain containing protein, partial [Candidatus Cloacimonetes bacterium]|nr:FlgD immunoglobulin-like domain containing protein [Candidatus Cloacimonadota bacterium]